MSDKKIDVFGVGNAIVDILAYVSEDFIREYDLTKGQMTLVDSEKQATLLHGLDHKDLEFSSGGSAANTMIAIARAGGTGYYSGKVARDPNGEFYRQDLVKAGIHFDVHPAPEEQLPTATCLVLTTPDAERTMFTHLGVSTQLQGTDIDVDRLKDCSYSYVEGYLWAGESTKEAALETFQNSKTAGVKTAFTYSDPGMVAGFKDDFEYLTREYVDVVFANADEARALTGVDDLEEAARKIGGLTELAFITNGKDGALVSVEGNLIQVPGFSVKAIDTNGAGDSFAGGVLYGLTHGFSPEKAARWGNYMASLIVQVHGPRIDRSVHEDIQKILG